MVKFTSLLIAILCSCSVWYSAEAILVEGSRWTMEKKEILFLFDIHHEPELEQFEKQEVETFIEILKVYAQLDEKPLYILIEEAPYADSLLGQLRKRLAEEGISSQKIIVENIEQRAASAAASDLLSQFPDHSYLCPRISNTQTVEAEKVTMQEVLDEYALIKAYIEECCRNSSDKVKGIHEEHMGIIECLMRRIMQKIQTMSIAVDKPLVSLLDSCSPEDLIEYKRLGKLIFSAASAYIDLYAFHRVLLLSEDYKVVLIAGGGHCSWIQGGLMGRLDARSNLSYGKHGSGLLTKGEELHPLQADQLKSLICA